MCDIVDQNESIIVVWCIVDQNLVLLIGIVTSSTVALLVEIRTSHYMWNHWSCSNIINIIIELHCDITIFYDIIGQYRDIINIYGRISAPDHALRPSLISRNLVSGASYNNIRDYFPF